MAFLNRASPPSILTLTLLAGISALSMNIFLPSLPMMAAYFNVPYGVMQQSVSLYLALSAVLQIAIGPLSDRFGRRPVLLGALALFLLATLGTILAPTAGIFLAFRMLQAVVAAGTVLSRAVIRDMVDGARAASMIGYVTMGMALVPMVGPSIGGVLDEAYGWQASFAFLGLAGAAVLALTWADLGETHPPSSTSLMAQFRQYPQLLVSLPFWGYAAAAAFASGAFFAALGGAPFVASDVFGLTPAQTGLYFGLIAIGYTFGNFLAGRYTVRVGMNKMVLVGGLITLAGMAVLALCSAGGIMGAALFFGLMAVMGVGNGVALPSANAGVLSVRPDLAGSASGLGGALMMAGGAALAALAGAVLHPGGGEMPLVLVMLGSSVASVLCILAVMRWHKP
ncbi:MAG: Bcr/CflA family efflux MFS transporter [Cypionkella sp.]|nr:Bcr/CflA family efflux MFS transporter [Cypionkella sp.]